jgi:hypothetical protein
MRIGQLYKSKADDNFIIMCVGINNKIITGVVLKTSSNDNKYSIGDLKLDFAHYYVEYDGQLNLKNEDILSETNNSLEASQRLAYKSGYQDGFRDGMALEHEY